MSIAGGMSVTPSPRDQAPQVAASFDALPRAAQNGLALDALVTALGFPPDAIGRRIVARQGVAVDEAVVRATLTANGREFSFALGVAVPSMDARHARAAELWASAPPAKRDVLYDRCVFFQGNVFFQGEQLRGAHVSDGTCWFTATASGRA